jgi:hypothetical protein
MNLLLCAKYALETLREQQSFACRNSFRIVAKLILLAANLR